MRPPQVSGLHREPLLRRLDPVARDHLGLVVALAGSGKTTLMAQWAQAGGLPAAWCRLDSSAVAGRLVDWLWQSLGAHLPGGVPCVGPSNGIAMGSLTMLIGNFPAARLGDQSMHGQPIAPGPGCPTVIIGG